MVNNSELFDLWERDDDKSLAPLSSKQLQFIDTLISFNKVHNLNDENIVDNIDNEKSKYSSLLKFNKWLLKFHNEVNCKNDSRYLKIDQYYKKCQDLSNILDQILLKINNLDDDYLSAISKTKSFYHSCDILLQQQHSLIVAVESISEKLSYFEELETMCKKFSSPTMLTLNESLVPLLNRLDECINFMTLNENNYIEASTYLNDYRKFQSSALHTIRSHVINTLKQTATQVTPENETVLTSNESVFTLYYGKFQTNAHRIKTLMHQIEYRTNQSEIYSQYLDDCHQCYFSIRQSLIGSVLSLAMEEMIINSGRNYCSLIRSSANLYIHICRDEYQLYFQFFTQMNNSLKNFLDALCMTLYEKLRPIVIHLEHLESLSELCTLIKYEFIEDNLDQDELESFVKAMKVLLQDTQERLVYRCNIYIENNILNYVPASGDLAYPQKLEMMKSIAENLSNGGSDDTNDKEPTFRTRSDSVSSIISSISDISFVKGHHPPEYKRVSSRSIGDLHGMWYPTVRSSIMCLSKLYRSLDKLTFQGLSQEVLFACIESLEVAYAQIKDQKTEIDAYLFFIKYLLIIREQIAPFHIDTTIKEVYLDFTRTKSAVIDLLQKRTNFFTLTSNNALLKLMFEGSPQVNEKAIDSQKAVDKKIKEKCEDFIRFTYEYLTSDIRNFILSIKFELNGESQPSNEDQIVQYNENIEQMVASYHRKKETIIKSMSLYLSNPETEAIIYKQIKCKIQVVYEQLLKILITKFPNETDRMQMKLPTLKDIL